MSTNAETRRQSSRVDARPAELSDDAANDLTITLRYYDGDGDLAAGSPRSKDCRARRAGHRARDPADRRRAVRSTSPARLDLHHGQ